MPDTEVKPHEPYAVWRNREYRFYSVSWGALIMAAQVETVAVAVHVYNKTEDPLALGWIGLVRALPVILLAIAGGHLADRFNRRLVMTLTLTLSAVSTIGLTALALFHAPVAWFYPFLLLSATGQALGSPARSALLYQLVPGKIFADAMTWNVSIFHVGAMVGPVLGGLLLYPHDYTPPAFALAFLLRVISIGAILFVRPRPATHHGEELSLRSVLAGIRFVWDTKIILATITLDLFAVMVAGITYLLPMFTQDILGNIFGSEGRGLGVGLLRFAEAVGAITMAMFVAHRPPFRHAGRAMLYAVAAFGFSTILFGVSRWFWLSMVAMFLIGATDNVSVVIRHTLVQMLTPDRMRGRVSAVNNIFIVASNDIGGFESGATAWAFGNAAEHFGWSPPGLQSRLTGAVLSVVVGGVGAVLAVAGCAYTWPQLLKLGSLRDIKPADEAIAKEHAVEESADRA